MLYEDCDVWCFFFLQMVGQYVQGINTKNRWSITLLFFQFSSTQTSIVQNGHFPLIRRGADRSLARPASRCRRTESIVSLERGVCSCARLKVFSCYRGWKKACQVTCAITKTSRRELSPSFFFPPQGKAPKETQAILTETLGEYAPSKTRWPSLNVVIFPPVMRLVLDDTKQ